MAHTHVSQSKSDYYFSSRVFKQARHPVHSYTQPLALAPSSSCLTPAQYSSMAATISSNGALAVIISLMRSSRLLLLDRILKACSAE